MDKFLRLDPTLRVIVLSGLLITVLCACQEASFPPEVTFDHHLTSVAAGESRHLELELKAGQSALVRAQGNGAELALSLTEAGESIHQVGLNQFRLNPLFLTIPSSSASRSVTLGVLIRQSVMDASVDVRIDVFPTSDNDAAIRPWSGISDALTTTDIPFEQRKSRLSDATKLLRKQGKGVDALWADFFQAYFTYWYPFDLQSAFEITTRVEHDALAQGEPNLRLAALQLQAAILIERDDDTPDIDRQKFDRAKQIIEEIQVLSTAQKRPFQAAWALNNLGIGYYYRKENELAIAAYQQAHQLTHNLGDYDVADLIVSNWVLVSTNIGEYRSAIKTLESISPSLNEHGTGLLLADNQREIGRLYIRLADYEKAILHLSRAQKLAARYQDKGAEGRALLSLGIAQLNMGRRIQAKTNLELAAELLREQGTANAVRDAVIHLASIDRAEGNFERLDQHRALQQRFIDSAEDQAILDYQKALDQLALGQNNGALELLEACIEVSRSAVDILVNHLCTLEREKLEAETGAPTADVEAARRAFSELKQVAPISTTLKAQQLLAEIEYLQGNREQALNLSQSLVQEMLFYRRELPGVLGAWYWESRRDILSFYFSRVMEANQARPNAAELNFAAFSRIINPDVTPITGFQSESDRSGDTGLMRIRELLALRDSTRSPSKNAILANELDALLLSNGAKGRPGNALTPAKWIEQHPAARTSAVISYYFGPTRVLGWLASSEGVTEIELADVDEVESLIRLATDNLRSLTTEDARLQSLDRLGKVLLSGFQKNLPETLHFLISGPLTGFPMDALRYEGAFLAENHLVIQNLNLADHKGEPSVFVPNPSLKVLIAGDPVRNSDGTSSLAGAREEIEGISRIYAGSQVTVLKGRDFTLSAVQSAIASKPGMTHFASHAVNNIEYPELSSILLSETVPDSHHQNPGSDYLMPYDLPASQSPGRLVVLSACSTSGSRAFSFDANMGFVTKLLQSGTEMVVASLWPVSDQQTKQLMIDFYQALSDGDSPPEALFRAKRLRVLSNENSSISDWASFQLYSR